MVSYSDYVNNHNYLHSIKKHNLCHKSDHKKYLVAGYKNGCLLEMRLAFVAVIRCTESERLFSSNVCCETVGSDVCCETIGSDVCCETVGSDVFHFCCSCVPIQSLAPNFHCQEQHYMTLSASISNGHLNLFRPIRPGNTLTQFIQHFSVCL